VAADETGGSKPAPVLLRIKLRYDDTDTLVQRFAPNVGKAGVFLPTKSVQAIGAEVKFEIRLLDDSAAIVGLGRVRSIREADPNNPRAVFGMAVELLRVTRESRELILRILEYRRSIGLAEVAIPSADDVDAARRREMPSEPATPQPTAPPPAMPEPEPTFTAPRRASGPIAVAKLADDAGPAPQASLVPAPTPLAPEPSRRHVRRGVDELIASASSAIHADLFGGDDEVDVKSVLARARTLAGGHDLDAELDALRESISAPIEISVEAASAELARALGGAPVSRKNRSAWAPPPAVSIPVPVVVVPDDPITSVAVAPAPELEHEVGDHDVEGEHDILVHRAAEVIAAASLEAMNASFIPERLETEPRAAYVRDSGPLIDDDVDPAMFDAGEKTQFGVAAPDLDAADRVDAELASAEADVDAELAFAQHALAPEHLDDDDEDADEIDDFEILDEADIEDDEDAEPPIHHAGTDGDFVSRLELSNEHTAAPADPFGIPERDSVLSLAGALASDPEIDIETGARAYPIPVDPLAGFDDDERGDPPPIESDLENALEALDVDLDELGGAASAPHVRPRAARAVSDGVIIDFDDED